MKWLEMLQARKDDRGLFAQLRCSLVESKRSRAYPALARLGIALDDKEKVFVAGVYATHPLHAAGGDFGETCRKLEMAQGDGNAQDDKMSGIEKRFVHLLSAERSEIYSRVLRLALYAKANGVGIDYEKLESDLRYWGDKTRQQWALSFWPASTPASEEADSKEHVDNLEAP